MKNARERGPDGEWLRNARLGKSISSADKARRYVLRVTGVEIDYSTYASYESGRRPVQDKHRPILEQVWGAPPEPAAPEPTDEGALVIALRAQTDAINALVQRLDALAADPAPMAAVVAQTVLATLRASGVRAG